MDDAKLGISVNLSQIFPSPIITLFSLFYLSGLTGSPFIILCADRATVGDAVCIGNQRFEVIAVFVVIWCNSKLFARLILRR